MPKTFDYHPEMQRLIDGAKAQPVPASTEEMRANWTRYSRSMGRPHPPEMEVRDRTIPGKGGHEVKVRIYRPAGVSADSAPCVLYFHGGGFIKGDLDSSDTGAWGLAEGSKAVVVSVDYRLAPENKFPAAFDDCDAAVVYVAEHPAEFGIDPSRMAVAGDSAGGNLAAATALAARDRGSPKLVAQALIYPVIGCDLTLPSYVANAEAPGLTLASMKMYWEAYAGGDGKTTNPYAAPILAESHAGLPPAHIHTAEFDPLLNDGEMYAEKLRAAGVPVEYRRADKMIHGFVRGRLHGPAAGAEFAAICDFLRRHLG